MRLRSYLTLSVVACNLLMGANYNEWNANAFNDGDTITINHSGPPPPPPAPPPTKLILMQSITINNGNVTATIKGTPQVGSQATIGYFSGGTHSISGNGTIKFNLQSPSPLPAFKVQNTNFSITSGFTLSGATTAFDVSGGSFTLATNSNQEINIQGDLKFQNNTNTNITLKNNNQQIKGNISAVGSPTKIDLKNGGKITGTFTGSGNGNQFILNVDQNSIFNGNMSNNGTATITIKDGGKVQGNFKGTAVNRNDINLKIDKGGIFQGNINNVGHTYIESAGKLLGDIIAGGAEFKMDLSDNAHFRGTANLGGTTVNSVIAKDNSIIEGGINTDTQATILLENNSVIKNGTSSFKAQTKLEFKGSSKAQNASFIIQQNQSTISFENNSEFANSSITTQGGKSNITFSNSAQSTQGSQITVKNNATSDLTIKDNATIQGTTILTQSGIHNIIFQDNTSSNNSTITVDNGTGNLILKNSTHLQNTKIKTNGGNHEIKFSQQAKLTQGSFTLTGGTTNIQAENQSQINANFTQNGGMSNITLKDTSNWTGSIMQNQGTSKIALNDNAKFNGDITNAGTMTIDFKNKAEIIGNITQTNGISKITFTDTTKMVGNIKVTNGITDITFTGPNAGSKTNITNSQIIGNINAQGSKNTVTFTEGTKLTGNLILDGFQTIPGKSQANLKGTHITGNLEGYDEVTLDMQDSLLDGHIKQGGTQGNQGLKGTINNSTILGGFKGQGGSPNDLTITKSILKNGMMQTTGSLKVFSTDTDFYGGFKGINSNNNIQIANSKFNNGDFVQTGGSLKAELVNLSGTNDFTGTNSNNNIQVTRTEFNNLTQSGGGLVFQTDSKVKGNITGTNNSQNKISIAGADIGGNLTQNSGSMEATLSNGNVKNIEASNNAKLNLYATSYTAQKVTLTSAQTSGSSSDFKLIGDFTQTNGTSNLSFADSNFQGKIILNNTQSSSLVFTKSQIQDVQATGGNNTINLSDGEMQNFNGAGGTHGIIMTNSKTQNFNQQAGSLTLNASSQSMIQNISSNQGNLAISLSSQSKVIGNIQNTNGNTTLSLQDAEVGGNITQNGKLMIFNASNSNVVGNYSQTGGVSTTNLTNSKIQNGITFTNLTSGSLTLNQNSQTKNLKSTNSTFNLNLRNGSLIEQGLEQTSGRIIGTLNSKSEIKGGLNLKNGATSLSLYQKSKISGPINAENNQTTLLVDDSEIEGNITVNRGFLHLTAQNESTIKSPQLKLTDAALKLTLDTKSKFIGDLTQNDKQQDIIIKQDSIFQGNITNFNTVASISINHSKLTGNLTQTKGQLRLDLSNEGNIGGNVSLQNVRTILSGTGTNNVIEGNFSQTNGRLEGAMNGLTLKGSYSQTGGDSNVTFTNSAFQQSTTITNANQSSLTFDQSTLKAYTTDGGNNVLKLLNQTVMTGDLTLKNNAKTQLQMDQSMLTGNIKGSGNSILTLNLSKSTITGNVDFNTGGIKGNAQESTIGGDIKLENTDSQISFNKSTIKGDFEATKGSVKLDLSNGSILQKNLTINNAIFHLTGSPAGNKIQGNLSSTESTLTGDISSLTLEGTFTQTKGTSKIVFRDESLLKGEVTITNAVSSHLEFINKSGIQEKININGGNDNQLILKDQSFIKGDITTNNQSKVSLSANQSLVLGSIKANNAGSTNITLDNSVLKGDIEQTKGIFKLQAQNQSNLQSSLTLKDTQQASISLLSQSSLTGKISATNSDLTIKLDSASLNTLKNPQEVKITDSSLTLQASNQSIFGGNLIQTSATGNHHSTLNFMKSMYSGTIDLTKIKTTANFTQSKILSDSIKVKQGSFDLTFDNSKEGGLIKVFEAEDTMIKILTKNQSSLQISEASITKSTLSLKAQDSSRLTIDTLKLDTGTTATYEALTNGNLNVNTFIKDAKSTLSANIHGGILQGTIIQDHINAGEITLREDGGLGGRWGITGDSQIKSLNIANNAQVFEDGISIFSSIANNRLSFVDFTMEFSDGSQSSRMGKAIIAKPQPQPNGVIPPPPPNQTYARVLQTKELTGNGLFRVYADLGSKMADSLQAEKASGEHIIQVYYRAETFRDIGKDRIVVAKVDDPHTNVSFKGTQSDVGLTRYDTEIIKENAQNGGFEWIIGQATPSGLSYASKIIASILQSQYRLFSIETDSLDRRLGGLEKIQRDKGFWVRSFFGQSSKKGLSYSIDEKDTYYSFWSGFDYNAIGLTGHNFLGTFFNYTGMNTESAAYLGKSASFAFGFYDVFKAYSGFYFDVLVKYIYSMSSFDISSYALSKNKPEINNHKFLANLEVGHTFYIGQKHKSLYIQPQFQITGGYIQGYSTNFIDVSGENIQASIGHNAPAMMRLGAFVGQAFGENIRLNIKGGSSFAYDINSGGELNFKDSSNTFKTHQKGDFRMLLSAHADLMLGDNFRLYSSFDTSFFGAYTTLFNFNFGLRLTFGKRNNIVPDVPMVYNPYQPPQPPPVLDRRTIPIVKTYTTRDIDANYMGKNRAISSLIPGNPTFTPINGYTPQPRRSYRDQSVEINLPQTNQQGNQQ